MGLIVYIVTSVIVILRIMVREDVVVESLIVVAVPTL
jgi:hypothetical protein